MFKLFKLRFPPKLMVPVVFVKVAVVAFTAPLKVVPPLFVIVIVFKGCTLPIAPLILTAAVVLMVKFEVAALLASLTDATLMGVATPVPRVSVKPSFTVVEPKVI